MAPSFSTQTQPPCGCGSSPPTAPSATISVSVAKAAATPRPIATLRERRHPADPPDLVALGATSPRPGTTSGSEACPARKDFGRIIQELRPQRDSNLG